jgi:hypothetical protein
MRKTPLLLGAMFSLGLGAAGCGGADPNDVPGGTIRGTITYSGSKKGPLTVGIVTKWPPMGAPLAFTRKGTPTFPAEYEITGVADGTYTIFAVLDNNSDNPQSPGPDDPVAVAPTQITVSAAKGAHMDIALVDP